MFHADDTNHLYGTPIPDRWTLNAGRMLRPLEVGMQLRYHDGTRMYVVGASSCAALVSASKDRALDPTEGRGKGETVSLFSEVEYRRAEGVEQRAARRERVELPATRACDAPVSITLGWPDERYWVGVIAVPRIGTHEHLAWWMLYRSVSRPSREQLTYRSIACYRVAYRAQRPNQQIEPEEEPLMATATPAPMYDEAGNLIVPKQKLKLVPPKSTSADAASAPTAETGPTLAERKAAAKAAKAAKVDAPPATSEAPQPMSDAKAAKLARLAEIKRTKAATKEKAAKSEKPKAAPVKATAPKPAAKSAPSKAIKPAPAPKRKGTGKVGGSKPKPTASKPKPVAKAKAAIAPAKKVAAAKPSPAPKAAKLRAALDDEKPYIPVSKNPDRGPRSRKLIAKCMHCGKASTGRFFQRGHVMKWNSNLMAIAAGKLSRADVFAHNPAIDKALGPWTKTKEGGWRPARGYKAAHKALESE